MKNLKHHYEKLYRDTIEKINKNNVDVDELIDSTNDNRYGITLLIRPTEEIKEKFQQLIEELKLIEPDQYYYPSPDIHITVLSIISCYEGFSLENINISDYSSIISRSLTGVKSFEINFRGITASPSCIMVSGYPNDSELNNIRESLRRNFKNSVLEQSVDKRYALKTAHSTIVRFKQKLTNPKEYFQHLENFYNYDFGSFYVDSLDLVSNDWYLKSQNVKLIDQFQLNIELSFPYKGSPISSFTK